MKQRQSKTIKRNRSQTTEPESRETSEVHDIFLRAHTVIVDKVVTRKKGKGKDKSKANEIPKWPDLALVFDTESRIDIGQELTFGFYRLLERHGDVYELIEEGAFYDDGLPDNERAVLQSYCRTAEMEYKTFPPEFPLHSRSDFIKHVFYKYARKGALIVGFNLPFDLARLARQWPEGDDDEWSLVLVEYPNGPENNHYSRVLIEPLDSKKAFIRFAPEWVEPEKGGNEKATKINESRFVDVRTLLWSLFNKSYSLKRACDNKTGPFKGQNLPQKLGDGASGKVTLEEVRYAQRDVKCTAALLNACKKEFDLHRDLDLHANQNYSPASMAKNYLEAMNINRPTTKFTVPPTMCAISMASYMGGRSETRLRHEEVPVVPVDFTSEYPSTCALLNLWEILTAERLSFPIATKEVRIELSTRQKSARDLLAPILATGDEQAPEFYSIWILNLFGLDPAWNQAKSLGKIFREAQSQAIRRYAAFALSASGGRSEALSFKDSFQSSSDLTRSALLQASRKLGKDERKHWIRRLKLSWFETFLVEYI